MKICITPIHRGRYKIEILDENNQVLNGTDGGSALVMLMLSKWLFEPEHAQYQRDQRTSSEAVANEALAKIGSDRNKYICPTAIVHSRGSDG